MLKTTTANCHSNFDNDKPINTGKISTVLYSECLREEWEVFVEDRAINSTFLHTRKFYDHNPINAQEDASLVFYKNGKIIAVFPAVIYIKNGVSCLHSHPRATYGGVIICKNVSLENTIDIIKSIILFAKNNEVQKIIIRNSFRIFHTNFCDETDYVLWLYGFKILSRELEMAILINGSVTAIKSGYHRNTAQNVKKALKFVEARISSDFEEYWILLENCLRTRHGKAPTHDINLITRLRDNMGSDKVILFGAYFEKKLIGGIVTFNVSKEAIQCQYLAYDYHFQHLNPVHAVIDYIIEWGNRKGIKYLNFGMGNEDDGSTANLGLFRFKESFGSKGVLRETMFLDL